MSSKHNLSVFIGRFQPPHKAHIEIIKQALDISKHVVILVGSSFKPADIKNPFSHHERKEMIERCFSESELANISFRFISDNPYNNQGWIRDVQRAVDEVHRSEFSWTDKPDVVLIGHHKDESSWYLDVFPSFQQHEMKNIYGLDSTTVREMYFAGADAWKNGNRKKVAQFIPEPVMNCLDEFMRTPKYQVLVNEFEFIRNYKLQWANAPYAPTFVTTDALVVNMGHILLVQRRSAPGKGLWALPGGFLNQYETVSDCVIRELIEETKIKVPEAVLRGSVRKEKRYDHPRRSLRGRTITTAFLIELHDKTLPKVKGSDDAAKAKWFSLNDFIRMQDQMYEDHYHIVTDLLGLG